MRKLLFYTFTLPFYQLFKLWNPIHKTDRRTGAAIADIWQKRRSRKASEIERKRRKTAGEEKNKCFSCKTIRSVDFSGGES
jgi:hypothetical protein